MDVISILYKIGEFLYTIVDFIAYQFSWLGPEIGWILGIGIGLIIAFRVFGR